MLLEGKKNSVREEVDHFIFKWHEFPIDYWWRKKYNVPFGSRRHREMSFIDMLIEWREDLIMNKSIEEEKQTVDENVVQMTAEEIDDAYENLNLEDFDDK
jgi:hypothetical protein